MTSFDNPIAPTTEEAPETYKSQHEKNQHEMPALLFIYVRSNSAPVAAFLILLCQFIDPAILREFYDINALSNGLCREWNFHSQPESKFGATLCIDPRSNLIHAFLPDRYWNMRGEKKSQVQCKRAYKLLDPVLFPAPHSESNHFGSENHEFDLFGYKDHGFHDSDSTLNSKPITSI